MRKLFATALAGVTLAGSVATAADAHPRQYRHNHRGGGDATAAAIIGGVAGLALGAALSSNGNNRSRAYYGSGYGYDDGGYRYRDNYAYGNGYGYDPRYDSYYGGYYAAPRHDYRARTCTTRERAYDPYSGRDVVIKRRYAC